MCSLNREGTQKSLLTETELSFAKAVEIALGRETAERMYDSFKDCLQPLPHKR